MESKDYYKGIVKDYLKQHHPRFYKELKKDGDLDEVATGRADYYLRMMESSSNPQDEKEVYYRDMLTF